MQATPHHRRVANSKHSSKILNRRGGGHAGYALLPSSIAIDCIGSLIGDHSGCTLMRYGNGVAKGRHSLKNDFSPPSSLSLLVLPICRWIKSNLSKQHLVGLAAGQQLLILNFRLRSLFGAAARSLRHQKQKRAVAALVFRISLAHGLSKPLNRNNWPPFSTAAAKEAWAMGLAQRRGKASRSSRRLPRSGRAHRPATIGL